MAPLEDRSAGASECLRVAPLIGGHVAVEQAIVTRGVDVHVVLRAALPDLAADGQDRLLIPPRRRCGRPQWFGEATDHSAVGCVQGADTGSQDIVDSAERSHDLHDAVCRVDVVGDTSDVGSESGVRIPVGERHPGETP